MFGVLGEPSGCVGPETVRRWAGGTTASFSLEIPLGFATVWRIVSCGGREFNCGAAPLCTLTWMGFSLGGNVCHGLAALNFGDGVGVSNAFDDDDETACCDCCIFLRSFCDILNGPLAIEGRWTVFALSDKPRDKFDVRVADVCSMIALMSSLLDGKGDVPHGIPGFLARPSLVKGEVEDGLAKDCSFSRLSTEVAIFEGPLAPDSCSKPSFRTFSVRCSFDGVIGPDTISSSLSISNISSFTECLASNCGLGIGFGELKWGSFDDLRCARC